MLDEWKITALENTVMPNLAESSDLESARKYLLFYAGDLRVSVVDLCSAVWDKNHALQLLDADRMQWVMAVKDENSHAPETPAAP